MILKRQYLFTERAHLMCPQMNFGIAVVINAEFSNQKVKDVMNQLEAAHPFLKCRIGFEAETNKYFYAYDELLKTEVTEKNADGMIADDFPEVLRNDYYQITSEDWNVLTNGLLKVFLYSSTERFTVLFVAHHLLSDGRGLLELVQAFVDCYVGNKAQICSEENIISGITDLSAGSSLPFLSRIIIENANKRWRKEKKQVSYEEYHAFAGKFISNNRKTYNLKKIENDDYSKIVRQCHENSITVNDYLLAEMAVKNKADKIVAAFDIRSMIKSYVKGSLGNYATAVSIPCKTRDYDLVSLAKSIHRRKETIIKDKSTLMTILTCYMRMEPGLLDASAISVLGDYKSDSARFVGGQLFGFANRNGYSITNLGKIENDSIRSAVFIPPASPAIKKIWGVLTVNNTMSICSCESV